MNKIFIITLFLYCHIIAQNSNSSFYPLQIGNKWEYRLLSYEAEPLPDTFYYSKEIIGDTLLPNGISYFVVKEGNHNHFERFDTVTNEIKYYENNVCGGIDESMYSLNYSVDSAVAWYQCGVIPHHITYEDTTISKDSAHIIIESDYLVSSHKTFQNHLGLRWRVSIEGGMFVTHLIGAVIDGKVWGVVTSVNDPGEVSIDYKLRQNYPNPFNPATVIQYSIPVAALSGVEGLHANLTVYDILGKKVATLLNEYKKSGSYEVRFDATSLTSGVYFYTLQAGNYRNTKKMLLVK